MLANYYPSLLVIHNVLRWFVLLAGTAAIVGCLIGIARKLSFAPLGRIVGLIYVSFLDSQFLIGVLLYLCSPIIHTMWAHPAVGMKNHDLRFFAIEHTTYMIIALALAHIGAAKSRKATHATNAYKTALIWYIASFVLILAGIPWWRPLLRL